MRKRARFKLFGLPAYDIALGPDLEKGERMGHAKGFFAIGDISMGGAAIGLGIAVGGLALGSLAIGGGAVGGIAVGGGAAGYYAVGGGAVGQYVLSPKRRDPEAEAFFREYNLHLPHPVSRRVEEER